MRDRINRSEDINTATHMAAAIFALFGAVVLILKGVEAKNYYNLVAYSIYGLTLVALFTFSALYHGVYISDKVERRLYLYDYISIYTLILGTEVPVCLILFKGSLGYAALGVLAATAAFGITMSSIRKQLPTYFSLTMYICMGWLPLLLFVMRPEKISFNIFSLLLGGGLAYTFGAVLYALESKFPTKRKMGYHEYWHLCVIFGALLHFLLIYKYIG